MTELQAAFAASLQGHQRVFEAMPLLLPNVQRIYLRAVSALEAGNKVLLCGNGGSAADCQHLAAELVVRYTRRRRALPAIALTTDTSILTAHANDFGFDTVFARQLEALARPGDVLWAFSTSGASPNVNAALETGHALDLHTVAFTGRDGGRSAQLAHEALIVTSDVTAHIQEAHLFVGHFICDAIEAHFSS